MLHQAEKTGPKNMLTGAGITSLIFLAAGLSPVLGVAAFFMLPPVMFYYRFLLGRTPGMTVLAVAGAVALVRWGGMTPDVGVGLTLLALGFFLAEFAEKGMAIEPTILFACGAVLAGGLVVLALYSNLSGVGLGTMVSDYVGRNLELTLRLYEDAGMTDDPGVAALAESMDALKTLLVRILPALAAAMVLLAAWATILTARAVMKRKGHAFPDFGRLNRWAAPDFLVWAAIVSGGLLLLPATPAKVTGINGLIVLAVVYFFQGIAIVSFYFETRNAPAALRVLVYGMMAVWQMTALLVACLGFVDTWADFRRLRRAGETDADDDETGL